MLKHDVQKEQTPKLEEQAPHYSSAEPPICAIGLPVVTVWGAAEQTEGSVKLNLSYSCVTWLQWHFGPLAVKSLVVNLTFVIPHAHLIDY